MQCELNIKLKLQIILKNMEKVTKIEHKLVKETVRIFNLKLSYSL